MFGPSTKYCKIFSEKLATYCIKEVTRNIPLNLKMAALFFFFENKNCEDLTNYKKQINKK